jgi:hypothetical protein
VIKWSEPPLGTKEGYVGLVKLHDWREFLVEGADPVVLAERIFESNVRGFVLDSTINDEMASSIRNPADEPNFWLLNNGVTLIAAKAASAHLMLTVSDPQIVNGLQTSRVIFDTIAPGTRDDRTVLVRVIETTDQKTQDRIIKATNSQNKMQPASLRMTDQIHRDIEQVFKSEGLFYDRRKGFYKDQGQPIKTIVSVNAVAQGIISIMLQRPDDARARPGDYFKDENRYISIFANSKIASAEPVCSCAFFTHFAHGTAGAARTRHSLRPLISRRETLGMTRANGAARSRILSIIVIARSTCDEAIHSSFVWRDGLLRGVYHRAAPRADPLARNDDL